MHHNDTDIRSDTIKCCEGNLALQRVTRNVIEQIANIAHAKQPAVIRYTSSINDGVSSSLNGPVSSFRIVLILMVAFRMPTTAVIHSGYVFYFVRNLYLGIITDDLAHSSPKSDVLFKGIDKNAWKVAWGRHQRLEHHY